jgi:hypothetical protein
MTDQANTPSAAEFDACCDAAGLKLDARNKAAVLTTAQWLAGGLARLRGTYPTAPKDSK